MPNRIEIEKVQDILNRITLVAQETPHSSTIEQVKYILEPAGSFAIIIDRLDGHKILEPTE